MNHPIYRKLRERLNKTFEEMRNKKQTSRKKCFIKYIYIRYKGKPKKKTPQNTKNKQTNKQTK